MRKKGMGKAAAVIAAAMLFSLFSEAGMGCTARWYRLQRIRKR